MEQMSHLLVEHRYFKFQDEIQFFPYNNGTLQEAQLLQRNSASAAHMEWAKPSSPLPLPPPATPMRTVESETRNKRTPSVPSVKRTLS